MTKIIIIGNGGTGKSTLGDQLSRLLSIPIYHIDELTMKEGWERVPESDFLQHYKK
jgi:adenylate kinase family enzyme